MKKPKKTTTSGKPRAGRAPLKRSTSTAKSAKAQSTERAPANHLRKAAATKGEPAPQAEPERRVSATPTAKSLSEHKRASLRASAKAGLPAQPPIQPKRVIETPAAIKTPSAAASLARPRRARIKATTKLKGTAEAAPAPATVKHASLAELVAEAKTTSEQDLVSLVASEAKEAIRATRKAPTRIPSILLEGDKPEATPASGPGQRYALGPSAPVEKLNTEGELPESYETGEVILAARDPHWLYAHWDLSDDQQRRYNAFSRDGHLVVRIHIDAPGKSPVAEVHVHPESRHWFIHVERANTRYVAELGYYSAADRWKGISVSCATVTPPDSISAETSAEFTAIPFEVPMQKLLSLVKEAVHESAPLAEALHELRAEGHPGLPQIGTAPPRFDGEARFQSRAGAPFGSGSQWTPGEWTPAQERALAEVVSMDHVRRVWMGSLEITELIRRQLITEIAGAAAAELGAAPGAPTSPSEAITGISSPSRKEAEIPKGFWFNVNAELIVYGSTERDATVSIGGRKIKLRADGSFSYRFALPDGRYEMPVVAISADGTDGRAADMQFSRSTEYRGQVGVHPQDPALKQLLLENF